MPHGFTQASNTQTISGEVGDRTQPMSVGLDVAGLIPECPNNVLNHTGGPYPRRISIFVVSQSGGHKQRTKYTNRQYEYACFPKNIARVTHSALARWQVPPSTHFGQVNS